MVVDGIAGDGIIWDIQTGDLSIHRSQPDTFPARGRQKLGEIVVCSRQADSSLS